MVTHGAKANREKGKKSIDLVNIYSAQSLSPLDTGHYPKLVSTVNVACLEIYARCSASKLDHFAFSGRIFFLSFLNKKKHGTLAVKHMRKGTGEHHPPSCWSSEGRETLLSRLHIPVGSGGIFKSTPHSTKSTQQRQSMGNVKGSRRALEAFSPLLL